MIPVNEDRKKCWSKILHSEKEIFVGPDLQLHSNFPSEMWQRTNGIKLDEVNLVN